MTLPRITLRATLVLVCLFSLPARAEERLAMPMFPTGWAESFARPGDQEIVEYVPPGQTAENWQRKITLEIYHNLNNLPLDTFQRRAAARNREVCDGVVEGSFQSGVNNGFASAFWTLGCEGNRITGKGEARYTKIIQGASGLYILSQVWRTPAYAKAKGGPNIPALEIEAAMAFLTSAVICDADNPQHPCPDNPSRNANV